MKLLKKIAPLAIGMLLAVTPLAFALTIADWKTQFKATNTAVVVGSSATLDANDIAAAMTVAKDVGIDTTSSTVTGESYKFEKSSQKLTLASSYDSPYEIRPNVGKDHLPVTLADEVYSDDTNTDNDYTQKITMGSTPALSYFADRKYKGEKEPSLGFDIAKDTHILNYTLDFTDEPTFDATTLETTMIKIMGKDYYINDISYPSAVPTMVLLDSGTTGTVVENTPATIGGKVIEIVYVTSSSEVKLKIGTEETSKLSIGGTYKLNDGTYIGVKDVFYNGKDNGLSSAEISVGNGKIEIAHGSEIELNGETVDGVKGFITNTTTLSSIVISWDLSKQSFVTPDSSITLPAFETVKLMMTGVTFPTGEEIQIEPSGDDIAAITVPLKTGTADIDLLYGDEAGNFSGLGADSNTLLVTNTSTYLYFNDTNKDTFFVASYNTTTEAASYYLSATFGGSSGDGYWVTLHDEAANKDVCTEKKSDGECTLGDLDLTFDVVGEDYFNVTLGTGGSLNKLFTENGMMMYLPYSSVTAGYGYINLSNHNSTNGAVPTTWKLRMIESDKDDNIERGSVLNFTFGFTTDNKVSVTAVNATGWSGGALIDTEDSDHESGYVASDLATFVAWDKSSDNGYSATATYYGEQVYGNVFMAATGAAAGGTSWTPVKDSETSKYKSQNIVVIGGTAVNKVAREMLGLSGDTPVYGTDSAWTTATGVTGAGKGILWMKSSPYTEGTGKYALLVAGYEGADTDKVANFLDLKTLPAKEKAVIDTTALVEAA
jgi:hypothetical protein